MYGGAPDFTVWNDGTEYYAKNAYGQIIYSGTNCTTVIQNALDGLTAGRDYKEKVLLQGDFEITYLLIPSYTIIEIQGSLKQADNTDYHCLVNADSNNGNTDIEIYGGEIDGNGANQNPATYMGVVVYNNVTRGLIHDIWVYNGVNYSIRILHSEAIIIDSVIASGAKDDNIAIEILCGNITISNCVSYGSIGKAGVSSSGIEVEDGAHDVTIMGCTVFGNENVGINIVQECSNISIIGNTVYGNGQDGIQVSGYAGNPTELIVISGNTVHNQQPTGDGITLSHVRLSVVDSNVIHDVGSRGIFIDDVNMSVISNNLVYRITYAPIELHNAYSMVIEGNLCYDYRATSAGVRLLNTTDAIVADNLFRDGGYGVREEASTNYSMIIGNNARVSMAIMGIEVIGANSTCNLCWNSSTWIA